MRAPALHLTARPTLSALSALVALSALSALIALPALAQPRPKTPATFEAPDLGRRAARALRDPVVVDRVALERQLDALARELDALRRADAPPSSGGRRRGPGPQPALRAATAQLTALRDQLNQAPRLLLERRERRAEPPEPVEPVVAPVVEPVEAPPQALDAAALSAVVESIDAGSFRDDKLRVIRRAAERNHFTCAQVATLVERLSFGDDKVEAIVILYPKVIDPENDHSFDRLLSHASDRKALDAKLQPLRR